VLYGYDGRVDIDGRVQVPCWISGVLVLCVVLVCVVDGDDVGLVRGDVPHRDGLQVPRTSQLLR
jgi:hypothetical protein